MSCVSYGLIIQSYFIISYVTLHTFFSRLSKLMLFFATLRTLWPCSFNCTRGPSLRVGCVFYTYHLIEGDFSLFKNCTNNNNVFFRHNSAKTTKKRGRVPCKMWHSECDRSKNTKSLKNINTYRFEYFKTAKPFSQSVR